MLISHSYHLFPPQTFLTTCQSSLKTLCHVGVKSQGSKKLGVPSQLKQVVQNLEALCPRHICPWHSSGRSTLRHAYWVLQISFCRFQWFTMQQHTWQGFDCKSSEDQTGKEDIAGSIAVHSAFVSSDRLQVKVFYFCNPTCNRFNRRHHVTREGVYF